MNERFLGEIIRERRLELGLTIEKLSEGICSVSTLSRLENGDQEPTRENARKILQRLGLNDERYYAAVSKEEIELNTLRKDITALNMRYIKSQSKEEICEELLKKQEELEKCIDDNDNITRQFLTISKMVISKESPEEKIRQVLDAIKLTQPRFEESKIRSGLFTFDDVKLINQLAGCYSQMGNHKKAINILEQLLKNIEDRFDTIIPTVSNKTLVLYSLARELLIIGDNKRAKSYAEEGKDLAVHYCAYINLPGYLMILAECEHRNANEQASIELITEAYYLCKIIGDEANKKIIEDGFMEYYNRPIYEPFPSE
ncbi:Helix-turn-helix domain-containing protein [Butyrivibrio sp. INlla18]|uniref:helix-turn-helix domain-containing protein n=1 Tax=Butyrivibrio sp. INlla18 TaxID=1520806 RepID=UPI00088A8C56|nr:helix-turn-helix domain-containing protein [Butyrivibrio sp. INlla18]SDA77469.1 Helix-turn-helix domain-containing protein [Butyrivibrio sp. INlla18]